MKVIRDADGILRARTDASQELLGRYFEEEVQENSSHCRELLAILRDIRSGVTSRWEQTGNAHTIVLRGAGVTIESEFDEDSGPLHLSLDAFRDAVESWREAIEN